MKATITIDGDNDDFDEYCNEAMGTEVCLAACMEKTCSKHIKASCRKAFRDARKKKEEKQ